MCVCVCVCLIVFWISIFVNLFAFDCSVLRSIFFVNEFVLLMLWELRLEVRACLFDVELILPQGTP